ncbi:MAG: hypothetical protein CFH18_00867 [Alphaproteobacteria bacterium MarineAlpha5_Bin8]|nr:MAG: hypothetical protein CFH18_00867 [Alphaproteobacteria bacterium MarineAlpha5_Bin8]PPR45875.1 MAG: hypothetical protein CFH17_00320 [Alphaproteobacteria bacterium MarineAlpha5_Bin7]|tara:strand:- start:350 stop:862 length:513 start_codon:yes stop_codon:yes gene_type:complete
MVKNFLYNLSVLFNTINKFAGYICAFLVVFMTLNVFVVVLLRYLFGISFIWMQETYVWMHAYIFMMGAGFTYLMDDHVRIDIIYKSSSSTYRALVDIIGNILLLLPFLYIIWIFSFPFVYKSWLMSEISREAGGLRMLYLLKFAILIFVILLVMQTFSRIINNILFILKK